MGGGCKSVVVLPSVLYARCLLSPGGVRSADRIRTAVRGVQGRFCFKRHGKVRQKSRQQGSKDLGDVEEEEVDLGGDVEEEEVEVQ